MTETIIEEASRITSLDRQEKYGPPDLNLSRVARGIEVILKLPLNSVSAADVSMIMVWTKICREIQSSQRDNWVDMIGYSNIGGKTLGYE